VDLSHQLSQKQTLSQKQIESLNILSMDMQELEEFLTEEQDANPVLNFVARDAPRTAGCSLGYDDDRLQTIPALRAETAADILLPQLNLNRYTQDEANVLRLIADFTDDDGFLTAPPEELSALYHIPQNFFQKCLNVMQGLDPAGVCSRTLEECLLRQLGYEKDKTLVAMIRYHLADIAKGKFQHIAKALKIENSRVHDHIQTIRALNPRPLNGLLGEKAGNIVPDIILTYEHDSWNVELNDSWIGRFEICGRYASLAAKTADAELREYLQAKILRIHYLSEAIERRRSTLTRIGICIAARQSKFLLYGEPLVTYSMTDIANELGLHLSTVSRAIKGKYLQYPRGVREIRTMFVQGFSYVGVFGEELGTNREEAKKSLKKLLAEENKDKPYSDNQLAALLKKQGIGLSRRTVTKYREELGVGGMYNRRYA